MYLELWKVTEAEKLFSKTILYTGQKQGWKKHHNHRIFWAGREPQGSASPALKWRTYAGAKPTTLASLAPGSHQLSCSQGHDYDFENFWIRWQSEIPNVLSVKIDLISHFFKYQ